MLEHTLPMSWGDCLPRHADLPCKQNSQIYHARCCKKQREIAASQMYECISVAHLRLDSAPLGRQSTPVRSLWEQHNPLCRKSNTHRIPDTAYREGLRL